MSVPASFLTQGFHAAREALATLMGRTGLHLSLRGHTRSALNRAAGQLRQLETIVRRLVFLMAAALHITLAPPRAASRKPAQACDPAADRIDMPAPPRFRFMPPSLPPLQFSEVAAGFDDSQPRGPDAACLLARIKCLYAVLKAPDGHARRLARLLLRQRAAGAPPISSPPITRAHRLSPRLGAVSAALPHLLSDALGDWPDTS